MRFYRDGDASMTTFEWERLEIEYADVTFACGDCGSEDTREAVELVPARTMHRVVCPSGHVTVGVPPARFRAAV